MGDYRKLHVWERSHKLVLEVYGVTAALPKHELFGLTGQLRRSATSIPANIAEGCGRNSDGELARFMNIAMGSASELDYHLRLARDLGYLPAAKYAQLSMEAQDISKMLAAFVTRLRRPNN